MNKEKIAKMLQQLRGDKTMEDMANELGISRSAISMYETAQRIPRDEIKIKLAEYFQVTVQEIFFA